MALPVFLRVRSSEEEDFIASYALLYDTFTTDEGLADVSKSETFEDHTLNNQISASADWTEVGSNSPNVQIRTGGVSASQCARQITSAFGRYRWEEPGWVTADSFEYWFSFKAGLLGDITDLACGPYINWDPNDGVDRGEGYWIKVEDNLLSIIRYDNDVASSALDTDTLNLNNTTTYVIWCDYTQSTTTIRAAVYEQSDWEANGTGGTKLGEVSAIDANYTSGYVGMQIYCYDQFMWMDSFNFDSVNQHIGLTSPRTCEPGPGTLTVIDTTNRLLISGDRLVASGAVSNYDPSVNGGAVAARTAGNSVFASIVNQSQSSDMQFGYVDNVSTASNMASGRQVMLARYNNDLYAIYPDNTAIKINDTAPASSYIGGVVLRNNGGFYIVDGELVWVDDNTWPTNLSVALGSVEDSHAIDFLMELPLATYDSSWGGDWTEVTDTKTNPANGTTFDCESDYHLNATFTYEAGKFVSIRCRYNTSSNYVAFEAADDGKFKTYENVAGNFNSLTTTSSIFSDGVAYQIDMVNQGNNLKVYVDGVLRANNTTNAALASYTSGIVLHNLATNDIVLTAHPLTLGIADSMVVCPQDEDEGTHSAGFVWECKNVTISPSDNHITLFQRGVVTTYLLIVTDGSGAFHENGVNRITFGAGSVTDGDDVVIVADGTSAEVFVNGTSVGSTSSLSQAMQAGAWEASTWINGAVCDHMAAFPRDVTELLPEGTY